MKIWWYIREFIAENAPLVSACGVVIIGLIAAAILLAKTGRSGLYLALSAVLGGGFTLFVLCCEIDFILTLYAAAVLFIVSGGVYFLAFCVLFHKQKIWERRARRAEQTRRLQYSLPDRENTFVQARLNTLLRTGIGEDGLPDSERVDLRYAKKMLACLQEKSLSAAERLQAEEIGKSLAMFLQKPRWSSADLRSVNDNFSVLMKLCTKYCVEAAD